MIADFPYEFGARVFVDDDIDLSMRVTAYTTRPDAYTTVECSYFLNGEHKSTWIELWRLKAA